MPKVNDFLAAQTGTYWIVKEPALIGIIVVFCWAGPCAVADRSPRQRRRSDAGLPGGRQVSQLRHSA